jgi:hypothetical protein
VDWMFDGLGRVDPYAGVADTDWMVASGLLESVPYVGGVPMGAEQPVEFM